MATVVVLAAIAIACGKKGPPLPPIVHIPTAVEQVSARRAGNDVFVTMTVPSANIDKTKPADIERIEVYGYTGTSLPPKARFLDVATPVATVAVLPPASDDAKKAEPVERGVPPSQELQHKGQSAQNGNPETTQGAIVTVRDRLTAESLVARPLPPPPATAGSKRNPAGAATAATVKEGALRRFYLAVPFSDRGRPGPPGTIAEVPLTRLPDPPLGVAASLAADGVSLQWEPSGGVVGLLLEHPLPIEPSPIDEPSTDGSPSAPSDFPDGPTRYNVYRSIESPAGTVASSSTQTADDSAPVNSAPLSVMTFSEPLPLLDGRKRCYTVRAVRGSGVTAVEGEASAPPACVTTTDDFGPAAPVGLSLDSSEPGEIRLSWEPNTEADLAGYVVLRGEAGDATLAPLTGSVTTEARFVDRTVRPGVRYVYAVQAIDTHLPTPNVSAESARVEETAR